jgi:hypothetical protein
MEEHKVLTGMLLVALVVSVVGTVITVDRLGALGGASGLTGAVAGSGDINITSDITITLTDSSIDFGNGKVDPTAGFAVVNSQAGQDTTDGTWANITDALVVRNDGNVGVNVTIQSSRSNGNHTTISFACENDVGGCGVGYESGGEANALQFNYVPSQAEASSCIASLLKGETAFTSAATDYEVCGCLRSAADEDTVKVDLIIGIPADAQGQKSSTLTFTSVESDVGC